VKRLIFVYSNSEFYLNVENIKSIEFIDDPMRPYWSMEILLIDNYRVDVTDYQRTFNFRDMMNEFNFSKGDFCKAIKCKSLTAESDWCSIVVEDWIRQATG